MLEKNKRVKYRPNLDQGTGAVFPTNGPGDLPMRHFIGMLCGGKLL